VEEWIEPWTSNPVTGLQFPAGEGWKKILPSNIKHKKNEKFSK